MSLERTGVVEEGRRRSAVYGRFIERGAAAAEEERLAGMVQDAVQAGMRTMVGKVVDELLKHLRPQVDDLPLVRMINDAVEAHVKVALGPVIANRFRFAVERYEDLRPDSRASLKAVVAVVADVTGVSVTEIIGPRRIARIADARQFAYWLSKRLRSDLSAFQIAHAFSKYDHTTVLHGVKKVEALRDTEPFRTWIAAPAVVALLNPRAEG